MTFFSKCKNYILEKWRHIEDAFFIGCIALQYNCDTGDYFTPACIASVAGIYLFIKTIYELFDGFKGDDDKSFTVFDFLKTLLVVVHIFVYFLSFVTICEVTRERGKGGWSYGVDARSLIATQTLYMFLVSQSIMANISTNSVIEVFRGVLGFYEIVTLSSIKNDKDYGKLLDLTYPMIFSFLPFVLGEASSLISKWLFQNKLSEYTPRVAKAITVIAAVMCTVVGIYGVFVMLNVMGNITPVEVKVESEQSTHGIKKAFNRVLRNAVGETIGMLGSMFVTKRVVTK
ncbi:hypothetical protein EROM_061600 [Encephalitozoon romaleae SJ-2008]|uniref:Uncharacterized protein n=2 Tax=Encephalitozoon romaleae TaxID=571949 RepID=I7AF07_ENCRO|nr:hypothetical protein EROM_061600 [Encephalitozoon romaleae SJ-2008]AFI43803.1 hypothetical protein 176111 [Encephalitozoon romaleae]AFN83250.1 hypothetical protein EROM_061600 [Encephalitozoon romaleae SJ-2008]